MSDRIRCLFVSMCHSSRKQHALLGLCLGLLCLMAACAPKVLAPPLMPADSVQATALWDSFTRANAARDDSAGPFRIQCSLRYKDAQGDGNRATAVIWGNGEGKGVPVRLDIMAGVGTLVARIGQTEQELLIHSPQEGKAWVHRGRAKALLSFTVPIPLSVTDFIAVLDGRFGTVLGSAQAVRPMVVDDGDGSIRYSLQNSPLPGTVTLNKQGLLTEWQEAPGGWTMQLTYDKGDESDTADKNKGDKASGPLPERIEISHPEGRHLVLDLRERTRLDKAFSAVQMRLDLPPNTIVQPLQQAAR